MPGLFFNVYFPLDFGFSFSLFTRENPSHWSDIRYMLLLLRAYYHGGGDWRRGHSLLLIKPWYEARIVDLNLESVAFTSTLPLYHL